MIRTALALVLLALPALAAAEAEPAPAEVPRARPAPAAVFPDPTRYAAYLRLGELWVTDPRFDLVGEDDAFPRLEVGLGWTPGLLDDALAFEAGYAVGASEAQAFDEVDAALTLHSIQAAALLRRPVGERTRAYLRGGLSLDLALLTIDGDGTEAHLRDTAATFALEGAAGWEVILPVGGGRTADGRRSTHVALVAEVGYAFRPLDATFDELERKVDGDVRPARIERSTVDAGSLDLSSWVLRLGGAFRF